MDSETKLKSSPDVTVKSSLVRSYPRAIVLLCVVVSSTNPLLTPAVVYFIVLSIRSWSKCRYSRAYRHVNNAAGMAIFGMMITIFVLVTIVVVFFIIPENHKKTNTSKRSGINASDIPEIAVNATASQPEMFNDTGSEDANMKRIEENMNKTDYNRVGHLGNALLPNIPDIEVKQQFINDTHVLIKDERTGELKLMRILVPKFLMRKVRSNSVNKSTT